MAEPPHHSYLVPAVLDRVRSLNGRRVLDVGCRDGTLTAQLVAAGLEVSGLDLSREAIEGARSSYPGIDFHIHDLYDPLPTDLCDRFDIVLAAEVIEHLFLPSTLFARTREALGSHGHAIITTPFHGYWKNLAMATTGRLERHWQPLDYGHVKFFSEHSLGNLAQQCGFRVVGFTRAGRIAPFAASMILTARPADTPQ
jgi:2-polyprenyl-3-methyl-5-hydroxy-6-metoxy-1,4-benzoquinol methylase